MRRPARPDLCADDGNALVEFTYWLYFSWCPWSTCC